MVTNLGAETAHSLSDKRGAHRSRGFGLLEAIVALVILGTSGLMLFSWLNQNLTTATRIKDAEGRAQLQLEVMSWLATLNPSLMPGGDQTVDGFRVRWRSELIEPLHNEVGFGGELIPLWQLGLYRVDVQANRKNELIQIEWRQVLVGWRPLQVIAVPARP